MEWDSSRRSNRIGRIDGAGEPLPALAGHAGTALDAVQARALATPAVGTVAAGAQVRVHSGKCAGVCRAMHGAGGTRVTRHTARVELEESLLRRQFVVDVTDFRQDPGRSLLDL